VRPNALTESLLPTVAHHQVVIEDWLRSRCQLEEHVLVAFAAYRDVCVHSLNANVQNQIVELDNPQGRKTLRPFAKRLTAELERLSAERVEGLHGKELCGAVMDHRTDEFGHVSLEAARPTRNVEFKSRDAESRCDGSLVPAKNDEWNG
jgi:hypothetical protein